MSALGDSWNRFWFAPEPTSTLAVLRIAVGLLLFAWTVTVLPDLGAQRLAALRRADLQALVDRLVADGRSASKVHNVLMPVRVLCRHAIERDELLVPHGNLVEVLDARTGKLVR